MDFKTVPLIVPIDDRIELLPYFIEYYTRMGFRKFIFCLWNGLDNPCLPGVESVWRKQGPRLGVRWIRETARTEYNAHNGAAEIPGLNRAREELIDPSGWYCCADLDEFYWFTEPDIIGAMENYGAQACGGVFFDRVAGDGTFPEIPPYDGKPHLDDLFPCTTTLTEANTYRATPTKIAIARGNVTIHSGHHGVDADVKVLQDTVEVHHFKWHAGVIDLLPRRLEAYRSQKLGWSEESLYFQELFKDPDWCQRPELHIRLARRLGI